MTEPTLSGFHDLERVADLCKFFNIPVTVCINKCDLNPDLAEKIKTWCTENNCPLVGEIPYDPDVTRAQVERQSIVEYSNGPASDAISGMWQEVLGIFRL